MHMFDVDVRTKGCMREIKIKFAATCDHAVTIASNKILL
jgi:hypothetical protein